MSFSPSNDFYQKVVEGKVPGYASFTKYGHNPAISGTEEVIHVTGAATPFFPTAAVTVEVLSTDAGDTSAGAGARSVTVTGLNASFAEITEVINTNGVTPVVSTNSFIRINDFRVTTSGTYGGANIGQLTLRQSGGGSTFATMEAGVGSAHSTIYTTPANKALYVHDVHFSVEATKSVFFTGYARYDADVIAAPFSPRIAVKEFPGVTGTVDIAYETSPIYLPPKTDMWVSGLTPSGTANATAEYVGVLKEV